MKNNMLKRMAKVTLGLTMAGALGAVTGAVIQETVAPVKVEAAQYHGYKRLSYRYLQIRNKIQARWVYVYSDGSVGYSYWFSTQ